MFSTLLQKNMFITRVKDSNVRVLEVVL